MKKLVLLLGLLSAFGCGTNQKARELPKNPLPIDSVQVQLKSFSRMISGVGQLQAMQQTPLLAQFNGYVELVRPEKLFYRQGETIFRLVGPTIEYQRDLYQENLRAAKAETDFYQNRLKRKKEMFEKGFVSPEQWDELEKNYKVAAANQQKADSTLAFFLAMTNFAAPFDGYLTDLQIPENTYLRSGSSIATFWDASKLKLILQWYDHEFTPEPGSQIDLVLNDSTKLVGKVIFVDTTIDPQSGSREIWVEISSLPGGYLPGMWVSYAVLTSAREAPAIPESALLFEDQRYWVMVTQNGKYRAQAVTIGPGSQGWVAIQSGLKPGEWVITTGAYELYYASSRIKYHVTD